MEWSPTRDVYGLVALKKPEVTDDFKKLMKYVDPFFKKKKSLCNTQSKLYDKHNWLFENFTH